MIDHETQVSTPATERATHDPVEAAISALREQFSVTNQVRLDAILGLESRLKDVTDRLIEVTRVAMIRHDILRMHGLTKVAALREDTLTPAEHHVTAVLESVELDQYSGQPVEVYQAKGE